MGDDLSLAVNKKRMVNFMPHPLKLFVNNPQYTLDKNTDEAQSQFGHCGEEKKPCPC
jgi:hypothetical protein